MPVFVVMISGLLDWPKATGVSQRKRAGQGLRLHRRCKRIETRTRDMDRGKRNKPLMTCSNLPFETKELVL